MQYFKKQSGFLFKPKELVKLYIKQARRAGLSPLNAKIYAIGFTDLEPNIVNWEQAHRAIDAFFRDEMKGGANDN